MSYRSKIILRKYPKREQEVLTTSRAPPKDTSAKTSLLSGDDYQAPLTSNSLSPQSKWLIVRHNIHQIRSWGVIRRMSIIDQPYRDWYLFFQMRRELKRAEERIRAVEYRPDFVPIRHFDLPISKTQARRYNVSHVRSSDGIYYAALGSEPIVLQSLLYYFSKDCDASCGSIFYKFLCDINSVLDTNRQRIQRLVVLRKVALIIALAVCILILIMFFSLILSVLTTTSKLRQMYKNDADGGMTWSAARTSLPTNLIYEQS